MRERLVGPARADMAETLKSKYDAGRTVRQLQEAHGFSYGKTHSLLREAKTVFRGRGGARARRG